MSQGACNLFSRLLLLLLTCLPTFSQAAVNLALTVNPDPPPPGRELAIVITATNSDEVPVSDVVVTLDFPAHIIAINESGGLVTGPVDHDASCTGGHPNICTEGEVLQWAVGRLLPGQAVKMTVSPTVAAGTSNGELIRWVATLSTQGELRATKIVPQTVTSDRALTVSIDEDRGPVPAGSTLTYTLHYGNRTEVSVADAQMEFTLPSGVSFLSATEGGVLLDDVVRWNLSAILPGQVGQRQLKVRVAPSLADGAILESAAVVRGIRAASLTQRQAMASNYVGPGSPLAMSLYVTPFPAQRVGPVLVTLMVSNPTSAPIFGGLVQLHYPTYINSIREGTDPVTGPVDLNVSCRNGAQHICSPGEFIQWKIGTLAPGKAIELTLMSSVSHLAPDGVLMPWKAVLSEDSLALDFESVTLPLQKNPVLTVAIEKDHDPVPSGDILTYTLHYGNRFAISVVDAQLDFTLPAGVNFLSATKGGSLNGNLVRWSLGTVPAGSMAQQQVRVQVDASTQPGILLDSEVVIRGVLGPLLAQSRSRDSAYVGEGSPLALAVDLVPSPASGDEPLLVRMTVSNPTNSPVFGGSVQLRYPWHVDALRKTDGLITGPFNADASCAAIGRPDRCGTAEILRWDLGPMVPGQALELTLAPTISGSMPNATVIPWAATVSEDSRVLERESMMLLMEADPSLTVAVDEDQDPVPAGGILKYTLHYGNRSTDRIVNAGLNFTLPRGTSFLSATAGGAVNENVVSWDLGILPAGAVSQRQVQVRVDANLEDGTLLESEAVISGTRRALLTLRRATETAYVAADVPLALAINVTPSPSEANQSILVELTVTNQAASTVFGGVVRLHYPNYVTNIGESGGLVTGPVDINESCAGENGAVCTVGEVLQWSLETLRPGQAVNLTLSPVVQRLIPKGTLISWAATALDDDLVLRRASRTLPLGRLDVDGDGVSDDADNCKQERNPDQLDSDGDNIGNACDCDFNQDNFCGGPDFSLFIGCFNRAVGDDAICQAADMNGDGFVGGPDLSLFTAGFSGPPGPSGL